ncbi:phosphotransferase family protein [Streptomyces melanogenes]|uniref:phosphotransferase family protein n=1 Tax=Streptomyces melanogenes TaxID=67326 RepID=UPI0027E4D6B2|nr:aminoglycoside phosphotransferase family protein [Streptomyces melanogenes]
MAQVAGSPHVAGPPAPSRSSSDACGAFLRNALREGTMSRGHHHRNFFARLDEPMARLLGREQGEFVTVRQRAQGVLGVVIRTWPEEDRILEAIRGRVPCVPELLMSCGDTDIHSYVAGVPLSAVCPDGMRLDADLVTSLAGLFADLAKVSRWVLPPLPTSWPRDGDSTGFLRRLVVLAEEQVRQPNWTEFGGLFIALGVPEDVLRRYVERLPTLTPRPYALLHTDLHRDNVIVPFVADPPLVCLDWELASYGDPLHDLATHLVRMRYPAAQWDEATAAWRLAVEQECPAAVVSMEQELRHYVDFERAQSVFPDTMRAARSLGAADEPKGLDSAARSISDALERASEPLALGEPPAVTEVENILHRWYTARLTIRKRAPRPAPPLVWHRADGSVDRAPFPDAAVREALAAEGSAGAEHVFKGTGHLNTVVRVREPVDATVIVRRRLGGAGLEHMGRLDENEVLRALESFCARVRAPRLLAVGSTRPGGNFAIHSYIGGPGGMPAPRHPADGLMPKQADALVDQLCELALMPTDRFGGEPKLDGFYEWLCAQLADLVARLPRETMQLAQGLGLPDADQLRDILGRHKVTDRRPVLLHGDLNPWNLVIGAANRLTLIDWELAMIGDPLYDLVRHLHLTPHRPWIRDRMYGRWAGQLGDDYTKGWAEDIEVYQRIEVVRSAYVDLHRLTAGAGLEAPNVRRALANYQRTVMAATSALGRRGQQVTNPHLAKALSGAGVAGE